MSPGFMGEGSYIISDTGVYSERRWVEWNDVSWHLEVSHGQYGPRDKILYPMTGLWPSHNNLDGYWTEHLAESGSPYAGGGFGASSTSAARREEEQRTPTTLGMRAGTLGLLLFLGALLTAWQSGFGASLTIAIIWFGVWLAVVSWDLNTNHPSEGYEAFGHIAENHFAYMWIVALVWLFPFTGIMALLGEATWWFWGPLGVILGDGLAHFIEGHAEPGSRINKWFTDLI